MYQGILFLDFIRGEIKISKHVQINLVKTVQCQQFDEVYHTHTHTHLFYIELGVAKFLTQKIILRVIFLIKLIAVMKSWVCIYV